MRYVSCKEAGGPEVLSIAEEEIPTAGPGEILIQVAAAGVNRPDIFQRMGLYPPPPGASPILGLEVAGTVVELGEGVNQWSKGQQVCALVNGGGYAEYVLAPAGQCLPLPLSCSLLEAAALPETAFTVWSNVFDRAALRSGETFLVHGGGSGIGTMAIQMAAVMGARVFTTVGSEQKCRACKALGAELAVDYHREDFVEVLKKATEGRGVDVILDMVGGDYINRNIQVAAMDGRIVSIAFLRGARVEVDFYPVMLKRLTLSGSTLRPRSAEAKAEMAESLGAHIWPLIDQGRIKPVIAKHFPFSEVAKAHRLMESNQHIGKIVLVPM